MKGFCLQKILLLPLVSHFESISILLPLKPFLMFFSSENKQNQTNKQKKTAVSLVFLCQVSVLYGFPENSCDS